MSRGRILRLLAPLLSLALAACGTLYSKSHDWKLPGGLGHYTVSARLDVGLFVRTVTISVNGEQVLSGSSGFWSHRIDMSGEYKGVPLNADCDTDDKKCDISIAAFRAFTLDF
jgi:hypothetical protein